MNEVCLSWLADIVYIFTAVLLLILNILSYSKLINSNYSYMYSLGLNWNQGPIISINTEKKCLNSNSYLITDSWPGTNYGCYCETDYDDKLRIGSCNDKDDSHYCKSVNPMLPVKYKSWKGKSLCVERLPLNYLDLNFASSEKSCPLNTRSCGILDSLNNVLCLSKSMACPFNFMKVIPKTESTPNDMNYSVIVSYDIKILFSKNNIHGKILNEFQVSEDQPCADPSFKNYLYDPYILDPFFLYKKCDSRIGNIFQYDDRYWLIDNEEKIELYDENGISSVTQNLPEYPNHEHERVNLYGRNYIGIDTICLNDLKNGNSTDIVRKLLFTNDYVLTAIQLSSVILLFGIFTFAYIIVSIIVWVTFKRENEENNIIVRKLTLLILPFILSIVVIVLLIVLQSYVRNYSTDLDFLARQDCVDTITFEAANNFKESMAYSKSLTIISIIITLIQLLIASCEFLRIYFNKL